MGYQQQEHAIDQAKGLPAFFSILSVILNGYIQGVAEDLTGLLKAHAVLALVGKILCLIPLKPNLRHRSIVRTNL